MTKDNVADVKGLVKIQFDLPAKRVEEIEKLMELTRTATRKDYFNNALTLLEWAIRERYMGNTIASVDEQKGKIKELVMPILNAAVESETTRR